MGRINTNIVDAEVWKLAELMRETHRWTLNSIF